MDWFILLLGKSNVKPRAMFVLLALLLTNYVHGREFFIQQIWK